MKSHKTLILLSVFAISACSEDSSTPVAQTPDQQPIVNNPLIVIPDGAPVTPETQPPDQNPVQVPVDDQPGVVPMPSLPGFPIVRPDGSDSIPTVPETPVDVPAPPSTPDSNPTGGVSTAQLINGTNANIAQTFWHCATPDDANQANDFQLAFYADNTVLVADAEDSFLINWVTTDTGVALVEQGVPDSIDLNNISFLSSSQFQATLSVTGVGSAFIDCNQFALDGSPVVPVDQGTGTPDQPPAVEQATLINSIDSAGAGDFWVCELASGAELGLFFTQDDVGVLVSSEFPDGIVFSWSFSNPGVSMTLVDGNLVTLTEPEFDSNDAFYVETVIGNGTDLGSLSCSRTFSS